MRGLDTIHSMNAKAIAEHKAKQEAYQRYRLDIDMPRDLATPILILFLLSGLAAIGCLIMSLSK